MKTILIFGHGVPSRGGRIDVGDIMLRGASTVVFLSKGKTDADPSCIHGYEPDLIINISEPSEELLAEQKYKSVMKDAQIINLY
jgi:hypothetical protein